MTTSWGPRRGGAGGDHHLQLDTIIDEKRILDLPLSNPLNLIYLTPGVIQGQSGYASANGGRERGNSYQIDGIDNNYTQTVAPLWT